MLQLPSLQLPAFAPLAAFRKRERTEFAVARAKLPGIGTLPTLPLEGKFYDRLSLNNFVDLDTQSVTASIQKTLRSEALSSLLDADLPTRLTLSARPGLVCADGARWQPVAKAALSIRLLDLGSTDTRQAGYLKYKMAVRTDGTSSHGFEIDRRVQLFDMPKTTLFGNVAYKTNNKSDEWKTFSSFGLHQDFTVAGVRFAARAGLTPEGDFVYDLKL